MCKANAALPVGTNNQILKNWPSAERPREKLLTLGAASLSDAELLAIFLRTGVKGCNVVDLSRNLLSDFGSLSFSVFKDSCFN